MTQEKGKNIVSRGIFWSFLERIANQGIQFLVAIVLARLLLPEQFGLIAMLMIFMQIAQSVIDSGFGSALIQRQDATHLDECSVFYFNILVGFLAAGLLYLAAPGIAAFYKTPLIAPLARVLSLNLVINSFGVVQISLLTKQVNFKAQMKVSVIAGVLSGVIGISMAFRGYGVWSLVAQSITDTFFRTVLVLGFPFMATFMEVQPGFAAFRCFRSAPGCSFPGFWIRSTTTSTWS